ncbi:uncharacterized protein LOC134251550 [Saccostrea cucullata]|uniref:uncharacterized protein LOC134251550 n=1 Tax=Saccostrea cuccullata TaxID=36930 RepID=UPI002ED47BEF
MADMSVEEEEVVNSRGDAKNAESTDEEIHLRLDIETKNGKCMCDDSLIQLGNNLDPPPAHSNTRPYDAQGRPTWVSEIFLKLSIIDKKLSKINEINVKLERVMQKVHTVEAEMDNLKKTSGNMGNAKGSLRKTSDEVKGQISELAKAQKTMEDTITDLQCRSMRDNLLFFGLAEYRGDRREKCAALISDFCETQLDLPHIGENIERAHRIGKVDQERDKPRPIVVKFSSYRIREKVRENAPKLAGTRFSIQEQFPKKIQEARSKLYPIMNEARRNQKRASLIRDKLYINGEEYIPESANT